MFNKKLLGLTFGIAGISIGGYIIENDDGLSRSFEFWRRAMPIYLHYRYIQWKVRHLSDMEQDLAYKPLHMKYSPEALGIITSLKGFYIKIGQIASTRHDFLPYEYMSKMETLQDQCPPESFELIKDIIEKSCNKSIDEIFSEIDPEPLGAASIGQVHRAVLKETGQEVAVKVMYPNREKMFRVDLTTIKRFCRLAQPEQVPIMDEIEKQFLTEFDYRKEAENLKEIYDNLKDKFQDDIILPKPIWSTKDVLVMEFIPGKKLITALNDHLKTVALLKNMTVQELKNEIKLREENGEEIKPLTTYEVKKYRYYIKYQNWMKWFKNNINYWIYNNKYPKNDYINPNDLLDTNRIMDVLMKVHGYEILHDGSFNGDVHPGNVILTPNNKLGLIDYGQVKHLTEKEKYLLSRLYHSIYYNEENNMIKLYRYMGFRSEKNTDEVCKSHVKVIFDDCHRDSLDGVNIQIYLENLTKIDPVKVIPESYIMAGRLAILLRGLGYALKYKKRTSELWIGMAEKTIEEYEKKYGRIEI